MYYFNFKIKFYNFKIKEKRYCARICFNMSFCDSKCDYRMMGSIDIFSNLCHSVQTPCVEKAMWKSINIHDVCVYQHCLTKLLSFFASSTKSFTINIVFVAHDENGTSSIDCFSQLLTQTISIRPFYFYLFLQLGPIKYQLFRLFVKSMILLSKIIEALFPPKSSKFWRLL